MFRRDPIFTLGRKIDFNYKTNQLITAFAAGSGLLFWLLTGDVSSGLTAALAVFLTWALARELDPAHPYSAFFAAALTLFSLNRTGSLDGLLLFWLLLLLRWVNGTTGKRLSLMDMLALAGFTFFVSQSTANSLFLLFFLAALLAVPHRLPSRPYFLSALAAWGGLFIWQTLLNGLPVLTLLSLSTFEPLLALTTVVIAPSVFWFICKVPTTCDQGNPLNLTKLYTSLLLFLAVLVFLLFSGAEANTLIVMSSAAWGPMAYFAQSKLKKSV